MLADESLGSTIKTLSGMSIMVQPYKISMHKNPYHYTQILVCRCEANLRSVRYAVKSTELGEVLLTIVPPLVNKRCIERGLSIDARPSYPFLRFSVTV